MKSRSTANSCAEVGHLVLLGGVVVGIQDQVQKEPVAAGVAGQFVLRPVVVNRDVAEEPILIEPSRKRRTAPGSGQVGNCASHSSDPRSTRP